ncbi:Peroxidase [Mycena venus]|uniref:Peroxidase n=1 Tax=Mycena venus TaxID=2733690 RepID=A0A8H6XIU7_9AGAR|nr:Peroxidase [Mycena venus]
MRLSKESILIRHCDNSAWQCADNSIAALRSLRLPARNLLPAPLKKVKLWHMDISPEKMLLLSFFACLVGIAHAYIWPSPQLDALEAMRFDPNPFLAFLPSCDADDPLSGRSEISDWIRTAYHDMATHNVVHGTGGMDASIRFAEEQARPEDAGDGFQNTIGELLKFSNRYVSISDVLALAAITAVERCGGPQIAFRGGRIDAGEPNAPGVPEPQQSLDSHIASFARQGFTQTEMIGLVACGHTFGGVQHAPFPDIVPEMNDPNNTLSVAHFDSTYVQFDNNIATEYISGTTQNPLVVGLNETTNSDKRIFSSDGNVTMHSFADSPELFASTCAGLFARMLDTVPNGVQLTEVITPLPVKPDVTLLRLDTSGHKLELLVSVRFWNMAEDPARIVRLLWVDHIGGTSNVTLSGFFTVGQQQQAQRYSPPTSLSIDAAAGITAMRFEVNGKLEDQGGIGFPVQDDVVMSALSCFIADGPSPGRFYIAVRTSAKPTRVYLEAEARDSVDRPIVVEIDAVPPSEPVAANVSYSIWRVGLNANQTFDLFTVGAEFNGVKGTRSGLLTRFKFPPCE